ncbi:hypothetical protein ACF0H5_024210 [Mactra antiquata]
MDAFLNLKMGVQLLMTSLILLLGTITCILSKEVKIAVLLPFNEARMFSLQKVRPAIEYAIDDVHNETDYVKDIEFKVTYKDTNCKAPDGMKAAVMDVYDYDRPPNVFFGPVCDYTLAPVARQVLFWNIPLISVGAFSRDFTDYHSTEYRLLTRVGPMTFDSMCDTYLKIIKFHNWNKFIVIYDKEGQNDKMDGFCHLATSSLHFATTDQAPNVSQDYFKILGDYSDILRKEVGLNYAVIDVFILS